MKSGRRVSERFLEIDPESLNFTHTRVRPFFSGCGRRLVDTLESLEDGSMQIDALPQITILATPTSSSDGEYFSLNNRRLWVLKQLRTKGKLKDNVVKVRVKDALPRELERYAKDGIQRNKHASLMGGSKDDTGVELREEEDEIVKGGGDCGKKKKPLQPQQNGRAAPPLSAEAKAQLKAIAKKVGSKGGKNAGRQITSLIDELIALDVILESQETQARAELGL